MNEKDWRESQEWFNEVMGGRKREEGMVFDASLVKPPSDDLGQLCYAEEDPIHYAIMRCMIPADYLSQRNHNDT